MSDNPAAIKPFADAEVGDLIAYPQRSIWGERVVPFMVESVARVLPAQVVGERGNRYRRIDGKKLGEKSKDCAVIVSKEFAVEMQKIDRDIRLEASERADFQAIASRRLPRAAIRAMLSAYRQWQKKKEEEQVGAQPQVFFGAGVSAATGEMSTKTIEELLDEAVTAWEVAQAVCPDRTPENEDGPTCSRNDNRSSNGWCDPTYCPRAGF